MSTKVIAPPKPTRRKPWGALAMLGGLTGLGVLAAVVTGTTKEHAGAARGGRAPRAAEARREDRQADKRKAGPAEQAG